MVTEEDEKFTYGLKVFRKCTMQPFQKQKYWILQSFVQYFSLESVTCPSIIFAMKIKIKS